MNNKSAAKMKYVNLAEPLILAVLIFSLAFTFACQSETEKNVVVATPSPTPEKKTDDFEGSLASVRTGNFDFILAFRRTDGDVFSSDDKKFLKANSPNDTNQWVLTGDEKVVIAGSNYKFTTENLIALKKRFTVEDFSSKPLGDESGNSNQNTVVPAAGGNQNVVSNK